MKVTIMTLFAVALSLSHAHAQNSMMFLYETDSGYTYVDKNFKPLMNKHFKFAGRFFEGLAAATENGYVGYINRKGDFVIKPEFEYALPFHYGVAKVWKDGKPYLINNKGDIMFQHNYRFIKYAVRDTYEPLFIVTTQDFKCGVIDQYGRVVIDTVYSYIAQFSEGLAVASPYDDGRSGQGVINMRGEVIVPFGEYSHIGSFNSSRAFVRSEQWDNSSYNDYTAGFIDKTGELIFKKNHCRYNYYYLAFSDSIVLLNSADKYNYNLYDVQGRAIYEGSARTGVDYAYPLKYGYAMVCDTALIKDYKYIHNIIDKHGRVVFRDADNVYKDAKGELFFIKDNVIMDKNRRRVKKENVFVNFPEDNNLHDYLIHKDLVIIKKVRGRFSEWTAINTLKYKESHGKDIHIDDVRDSDDGVDLCFIDPDGFKDGLLYVRFVVDGQYNDTAWGYLNENGDVVYRNKTEEELREPAKLNINYQEMNGFFYNIEKDNSELKRAVNPNKITLLLDDTAHDKSHKSPCYDFKIINETGDTLLTQGYLRELISVQAKDRNGVWRPIQSAMPTDVLTDEILKLSPNHFWDFLVQAYAGGFHTRMRVVMNIPAVYEYDWSGTGGGTKKLSDDKEFVSNEIDCDINAAQFIRREFNKDGTERYPFEDYVFDRIMTIP